MKRTRLKFRWALNYLSVGSIYFEALSRTNAYILNSFASGTEPHDGTPADWALLALYADLPIATQSMLDDSAKMRAQGRAKICGLNAILGFLEF